MTNTDQLLLCQYQDINVAELESLHFDLLNQEEIERYHRIKHRDTQQQFYVTRILLKQQLAKLTGLSPKQLEFQSSKHGRPFLVGFEKIDFNVSHTKNLIAIAISATNRVGVDVENCSRTGQYEDIAQHYFHEKECQQIQKSTDLFFKVWTLKEAYIKALGLGLQKSLKSFYFDISDHEKITLFDNQTEDFDQFNKPFINGFSTNIEGQFQLAWMQFRNDDSQKEEHNQSKTPATFVVDKHLNLIPTTLEFAQSHRIAQKQVFPG